MKNVDGKETLTSLLACFLVWRLEFPVRLPLLKMIKIPVLFVNFCEVADKNKEISILLGQSIYSPGVNQLRIWNRIGVF